MAWRCHALMCAATCMRLEQAALVTKCHKHGNGFARHAANVPLTFVRVAHAAIIALFTAFGSLANLVSICEF